MIPTHFAKCLTVQRFRHPPFRPRLPKMLRSNRYAAGRKRSPPVMTLGWNMSPWNPSRQLRQVRLRGPRSIFTQPSQGRPPALLPTQEVTDQAGQGILSSAYKLPANDNSQLVDAICHERLQLSLAHPHHQPCLVCRHWCHSATLVAGHRLIRPPAWPCCHDSARRSRYHRQLFSLAASLRLLTCTGLVVMATCQGVEAYAAAQV